ncbi:MAG TPA: Holliday junction branch migration protein RuvA [Flavobacteriales bacterium]|jgi:Holliday junction DNA helicase RuvA|nr:Holliday junction branch migration protein RuvA [Flavobacteriales bacterium]
MIDFLKGRLAAKHPNRIVIDVNGVGYNLNISLHTYSSISDDEKVMLYTHLAIRDDAHLLYGFYTEEERDLFLKLISVSGIGASTAQLILSSMNPTEVRQAIVSENVNAIKAIKGIGQKTAQRLIIDLKDKVSGVAETYEIGSNQGNTAGEEALSALIALGFDRRKSEKMISTLVQSGEYQSVEGLIKTALKNL